MASASLQRRGSNHSDTSEDENDEGNREREVSSDMLGEEDEEEAEQASSSDSSVDFDELSQALRATEQQAEKQRLLASEGESEEKLRSKGNGGGGETRRGEEGETAELAERLEEVRLERDDSQDEMDEVADASLESAAYNGPLSDDDQRAVLAILQEIGAPAKPIRTGGVGAAVPTSSSLSSHSTTTYPDSIVDDVNSMAVLRLDDNNRMLLLPEELRRPPDEPCLDSSVASRMRLVAEACGVRVSKEDSQLRCASCSDRVVVPSGSTEALTATRAATHAATHVRVARYACILCGAGSYTRHALRVHLMMGACEKMVQPTAVEIGEEDRLSAAQADELIQEVQPAELPTTRMIVTAERRIPFRPNPLKEAHILHQAGLL